MAEPMDIDLSLDEIIAKKREQARAQNPSNHRSGKKNNRNGSANSYSNSNSSSRSSRNRSRYYGNGTTNSNSNGNRKNRSSYNSNRNKEQITKMDIDLSLDELIAKRKNNEYPTTKSKPYSRRGSYYRPGSSYRPSYSNSNSNSYSRPQLRPPIHNLGPRFPSRFITIGPFTRDVSPAQINDMMEDEVGPVQNVTMTLNGEAHVLFRGMKGWVAYDRFHGQYLDGALPNHPSEVPKKLYPSIASNLNLFKMKGQDVYRQYYSDSIV